MKSIAISKGKEDEAELSRRLLTPLWAGRPPRQALPLLPRRGSTLLNQKHQPVLYIRSASLNLASFHRSRERREDVEPKLRAS